ncbi:MAG: SLC13 family permease, partial [Alphaproteobacteria bacterium]
MTADQMIIFAVLAGALVLFIWAPVRFDVAAFTALMAATLLQVVPPEEAFAGFGHPAVITVATVLIMSRALQDSGVLDYAATGLLRWVRGPVSLIAVLTFVGALLSGFMNNVGALALLMPLALRASREVGAQPSHVLMPLAFGTILGGLTTLIGTPPNILVASYRARLGDAPFGMFDFTPVGVVVAAAGVVFIVLVGWRLVPKNRRGKQSADALFQIGDYVSELRIGEESKLVGAELRELEAQAEHQVMVVGLIRGAQRRYASLRMEKIEAGDILIVRADPTDLDKLVGQSGVDFVGREDFDLGDLRSDEVGVIEAVVQPRSRLEGRSADRMRLRRRYGINLLAIAREGVPFRHRLGQVQFSAGDVLLLHGEVDALPDIVREIGCLPLAPRALLLTVQRRVWLPVLVFLAALLLSAFGVLPVQVAFGVAVVVMIVGQSITARAAYDAIDWPVIILLGSMIPLGGALETSGGSQLIADGVLSLAGTLDPVVILILVMVVTMTLSDIMNNAATVVVMAPIAATIAIRLGVDIDAFLMAVAIGGSCSFLTPIGHQNNVLVMGPGGYKFGDYWRVG